MLCQCGQCHTGSASKSGPGIYLIFIHGTYSIVAVGLSEILKARQKLGANFNFNKQAVINFKKFSKMTMCRASEANS